MEVKIKKEEEKVLMQKLVKNLIHDSRLNLWEKEFIESINQQITSKDLTEKQLNILNKIRQKYAKHQD